MARLLAASLMAAGVASAAAAEPAVTPAPDCQCRDPSGQRRDLGTLECVTIGTTRHLVRCEMSTNTPYWRRVSEESGGCSPVS